MHDSWPEFLGSAPESHGVADVLCDRARLQVRPGGEIICRYGRVFVRDESDDVPARAQFINQARDDTLDATVEFRWNRQHGVCGEQQLHIKRETWRLRAPSKKHRNYVLKSQPPERPFDEVLPEHILWVREVLITTDVEDIQI